jgi:hypothetical protein
MVQAPPGAVSEVKGGSVAFECKDPEGDWIRDQAEQDRDEQHVVVFKKQDIGSKFRVDCDTCNRTLGRNMTYEEAYAVAAKHERGEDRDD